MRNHKRIKIISSIIVISAFAVVFFRLANFNLGRSASCGASCSVKQIGTLNPIGGNFVPVPPGGVISKNRSYWVRLTVNGQDSVTAPSSTDLPLPPASKMLGNDVMLSIDTSGSMSTPMKKYRNPSDSTTVMRATAAVNSINRYIDLSDDQPGDGSVDFLGLNSYKYCEKYYTTNGTPIEWVYSGYNASFGKNIGWGVLHKELQNLSGQKSNFKSAVASLFDANGKKNFCTENLSGSETDLGAGISIGNTQLTPILNDPDGAPYRVSGQNYAGINNGPLARDMSGTKNPKYIIIATDGEETDPPRAYDQEIDAQARSIVATAKFYNIRVYTLLIGDVTNGAAVSLLQRIASDTGGKFYFGNSEEELLDSYTAIHTDIVDSQPPPAAQPSLPAGVSSSAVGVNEKINASNFKIDSPVYVAGDLDTTTFRITKPSGLGELDITGTICGGASLTCISNKIYTAGNLTGMTITTDKLTSADTRYIYFRVTPTVAGSNVDVDNNTSILDYKDLGITQALDNTKVTISEDLPYFQTKDGGDVYSKATDINGSIKSPLSLGMNFATTPNSIILHNGGSNYGNGKVSDTLWDIDQYNIDLTMTYQSLCELYKKRVQTIPINGVNSFPTGSGYYMDTGSGGDCTDTTGGTFKIIGNQWKNKTISGKQIVVFVPGNLYIGVPFSVAKDGNSSITFIVQNMVGIDESVQKVEGIYIANGKIDTACNNLPPGNFITACSPDKNSSLNDNKLVLEGSYFSTNSTGLGGFNLDRKGISRTEPGELFVFRPDILFSNTATLGSVKYSWKEH